MDKVQKSINQTKIFLGYLFAIIMLAASVVTALVWFLAKDAKAEVGVGLSKALSLVILGVIAAGIYLLYAATAKKEAKMLQKASRELREVPFKYVADKTYRILGFILNIIFMVDVLTAMFFLVFGQWLAFIPKDVLVEAQLSATDITLFYNVFFSLTQSSLITAAAAPIVYAIFDLLLSFFKERNNLILQQAQDIEDLKNLKEKEEEKK